MDALFDILRREAPRFGPALAAATLARGLAVTAKDGSLRPIPVTATPVIIEERELEHRVNLAALLASAGLKMSRAVLSGAAPGLLLSALSPLERVLAEATWKSARTLATTRVDFFVGPSGRPSALELNATIPAMQGYSDIAAEAFLEVVGRHLGLPPDETRALAARNRPNTPPLLAALLQGFRQARGGVPERIALLCRRNDAQLTEQRYLCRRFRELGVEAEVVHPDQLSGTDGLYANGRRFDLVYRHLFVRRLEETDLPGAAFVKALLEKPADPRAVVLNPPASQVEVKATFALLSQALAEPALAESAGLSNAELDAIGKAVPWTRTFRRGPSTGPVGEPLGDLVERVAAEPSRFVLKRSWDYGGRAVFVGHSEGEPSFDERVRAAYGRNLSWRQLAARCAEDEVGGGFVVQERVETHPEPHLICHKDRVEPADLYVDFSAYASVGLETPIPWGGVCRGSMSQIVNIVGGGGVLPLLTGDVARALLAAARAL